FDRHERDLLLLRAIVSADASNLELARTIRGAVDGNSGGANGEPRCAAAIDVGIELDVVGEIAGEIEIESERGGGALVDGEAVQLVGEQRQERDGLRMA